MYRLLLIIHILSATAALLSGLVAILARKVRGQHNKAGIIYYFSMYGTALSAVIMAVVKWNPFLLSIAVFALYLTYTGRKAITYWRLKETHIPSLADKLPSYAGIVTAVFMMILPVYQHFTQGMPAVSVLQVFGAILLLNCKTQLRLVNKPGGITPRNKAWLARHIASMGGAYISTVTAFLVVNVQFSPGWVVWLAPSAVGAVLITIAITRMKLAERKALRTATKNIVVLLCVLSAVSAKAQPYTDGRHTRHRFAQLNVGLDARLLSGSRTQSYYLENAQLKSSSLGDEYESRIIIGGTHFWGHVDFFIAIPVLRLGSSGFYTGPETGFRYYPWAIEKGKVRPFVGASYLPAIFQQGDGVSLVRGKVPALAGATVMLGRKLIDLGLCYNYDTRQPYYVSTATHADMRLPSVILSAGLKWQIETTISAEHSWLNGQTKALTDTLAKKHRLNGFTIAAGPSSAFFVRRSSHNESIPFLDNHKIAAPMADLGLGYYLHNSDIQLNLAWRGYTNEIAAYGYTQWVRRRSLALECFKFMADYHGFVPFAGIALSREWLTVKETAPGPVTAQASQQATKYGIVAGWDIRPDRLQQFYLRTNIRYFPNLDIAMPNGKSVAFDALEVNFIQLVVFPGRIFKW